MARPWAFAVRHPAPRRCSARYAFFGAVLWNAALIAGLGSVAAGINDGLEMASRQIGILFAVGGALIGLPLVFTLVNRQVEHLYVSVWYMGCAVLAAGAVRRQDAGAHRRAAGGDELVVQPQRAGPVVHAAWRWPIYYFLPKVIGRPIRSYNPSIWASGAGLLLRPGRRPPPDRRAGFRVDVTLSIVQSMMMIIPVARSGEHGGHHAARPARGAALVATPALHRRGRLMQYASSVQGSFEALRSERRSPLHALHGGHAHLGLYGFTLVLFGAMYFVMPRVTAREWPYPRLISAAVLAGGRWHCIYFVALTIGGWLQGLAMLDAARPFMDSVAVTLPT